MTRGCGKVANVIPFSPNPDKAHIEERYMAIIEEICRKHWVTTEEVLSGCREEYIRDARDEAIYEIRKQMGFSTPRLGKIFRKDHSTIIYVLKKRRAKEFIHSASKTLDQEATLLVFDY